MRFCCWRRGICRRAVRSPMPPWWRRPCRIWGWSWRSSDLAFGCCVPMSAISMCSKKCSAWELRSAANSRATYYFSMGTRPPATDCFPGSSCSRLLHRVGATRGGEQSGHILFLDGEATTGDGLLTALRVLEIMVRTGKPLADLVGDLKVFPQTIRNVRVRKKIPFAEIPAVQAAISAAERELDGNGRVVVRYSGTEALARVMIETESKEQMDRVAESIVESIRAALGA